MINLTKTNLVFLGLGFAVGLSLPLIVRQYKTNSFEQIHEVRKNFNYKYINPLLECDSMAISQDKNTHSLKSAVEYIIEEQKELKKISFASVYYRDLNNGPWFGIDEKELFSPASLIKVPVMMAYYKMAESDPKLLDKKIINNLEFNPEEQNIQPEKILQKDTEYTIGELIERMITYSDNLAYDLLLNNVDNFKIFQIYKDLDVDISKAAQDPNGNIITVKDYASFFRILFNSSYLNRDMSEKALRLLTQTAYKKALAAGIPDNIEIAHKFGERQYLNTGEKQLHDCGVVYSPRKPYLLCVMTRSDNFENASHLIKNISLTVYNQINPN